MESNAERDTKCRDLYDTSFILRHNFNIGTHLLFADSLYAVQRLAARHPEQNEVESNAERDTKCRDLTMFVSTSRNRASSAQRNVAAGFVV